jgi:hypothetical protein
MVLAIIMAITIVITVIELTVLAATVTIALLLVTKAKELANRPVMIDFYVMECT